MVNILGFIISSVRCSRCCFWHRSQREFYSLCRLHHLSFTFRRDISFRAQPLYPWFFNHSWPYWTSSSWFLVAPCTVPLFPAFSSLRFSLFYREISLWLRTSLLSFSNFALKLVNDPCPRGIAIWTPFSCYGTK